MQTHLDLWIANRWAADLQRVAARERLASLDRTRRPAERSIDPPDSLSPATAKRLVVHL
jgi:hypothetical protein